MEEGLTACGGGCVEHTGGQGGALEADGWRLMQCLVQNLGCGVQVWLELSPFTDRG